MENVLVTGASGGIGTALCVAFAQTGRNVAVHYHNNRQQAENLARVLSDTYRVKTAAVQADVADRQSVNAMLDAVSAQLGDIDILVNNAGIAQQKLFTDITADDWNKMLSVNLGGVFNCCQSVLPYMIRRKSGKIINISSVWGSVGASCEVHYSAVKAGIIGLSKALAKEVAPSHITVNCIAPGCIMTDMLTNELDEETISQLADETPLGRIGTPKDIAKAAAFLAGSGADFITGQVLGVDGGFC